MPKGNPNIKRKPLTKQHKENISKGHMGLKPNNRTRKKMSLSHKNKPSNMLGKKHSKESKEKMKMARTGKIKENASNWQGGKSFEPYSVDWTETLRISIRERDKYTCKICGKKQGDRAFSVHHIDYNKLNCSPENLITLCLKCHLKTNSKRDKWIRYFKYLDQTEKINE